MLGFLWDLDQQRRIRGAESTAAKGRADAAEARHVVRELEDRVETLVLVNMALWSFMEQKLGLTEADLEARVEEIDLRDGKRDGRAGPSAAVCSRCGRRLSSRHFRCIYCGAESGQPRPCAGL